MFSLFGNTKILCRKWINGRNCAYHNFQCFMYHPNLGNYLWNWLNVINNNGRIGLLNCNCNWNYISVPILHQTWIQLNFHLKIFFLQIRYESFWNESGCNRFWFIFPVSKVSIIFKKLATNRNASNWMNRKVTKLGSDTL